MANNWRSEECILMMKLSWMMRDDSRRKWSDFELGNPEDFFDGMNPWIIQNSLPVGSIAQSDNLPAACLGELWAYFDDILRTVHGGFVNLGPNLQNFVKWTFVILSQFFRISFVSQLISYRAKSLRKICERITKNIRWTWEFRTYEKVTNSLRNYS